MLDLKQVRDIERFLEFCIHDASVKNNVVTLIRGDGQKFTVASKGPKGYQGPQGDSAYDLAVQLGKTDLDLDAWLESLKGAVGDRGPAGVRGEKGPQGNPGTFPVFNVSASVFVNPDQEPSLTISDVLNGEQSLFFSLPKQDNTVWLFGMPYNIEEGNFTIGEPDTNAKAVLRYEHAYLWLMDVTIPAGIQEYNDYSVVTPDINLLVNYDNVEEPVIETEDTRASGLWKKDVTLTIPKGPAGDKGPRGPQTTSTIKNATSLFKTVTDPDEVQDPGQGFCTIAFPCAIQNINGKAAGWSWRTTTETFQQILFKGTRITTKNGWYYRQGPPQGLVAESEDKGWIKSSF